MPELPSGTVTLLFTDIEDSTPLLERLGATRYADVLREHHRLLRAAIGAYGGYEVDTAGDGFFVAFGRATDALAAALLAQRALFSHPWPEGSPVRVRMGIHTGQPQATDGKYVGLDVHRAARVAAAGHGGQVLLTQTSAELLQAALPGGVVLRDVGEHRLKGLERREHLSQVVAADLPAEFPPLKVEDGPEQRGRSLPAAHTPFVGRQEELSQLGRRLAAAAQGRGGMVLVGGEPGIGKTRLVLELAAQAAGQGWQVLVGHAYETRGMPPYLPFVEALEDYVRACSLDALKEQLGDGAPEVALVLPELTRRLPDLSQSPPLLPEQARYRLFSSLCDFLLAIARAAPRGLLLVLDDLHWADRPALLLLQHVARRLGGSPLLIAGTYRRVELDRAHALTSALAEMRREGVSERLLLTPLRADEIAALIQEMVGAAPAAAVVKAVERETDGNPFFVGEVIRRSQAEGRDLTDARATPAAWGIPEGVREVIGQRLSHLSAEANRVLQAAAVLGDGFSFELLQQTSGVEEAPLLDALDEALAAGMLRGEERGYRCSHALIRQTLYEDLSLPRRQRLHRRAAEAIESVYAQSLGDHAAALAVHYLMAGPAAEAARTLYYSVLAAQRAAKTYAWEEAVAHYRTALEQEELQLANQSAGRQSDAAERVQLQAALAEAMSHTDDVPGSVALLHEVLAQYERAGDEAAALETRWRIVQTSEQVNIDTIDGNFFEESVARLGQAPSRLRALFLAYKAPLRDPACLSLAQEAMAIARQVSDVQALVLVARRACRAAIWQARFAEAAPIAQAMVEAAAESGDPYARNLAFQELFHVLFHTGRVKDARAAIEQGLTAASQAGDRTSILNCRGHLLMVHCFNGQWSRVDELWQADADHWIGAPEWSAPFVSSYARWLRELWAGDPARGSDLLRLVSTHNIAISRMEELSIQAQMELRDGLQHEAALSLKKCLVCINEYSNPFWRAQMAVTLPPVAIALGKQEVASEIERMLLPYKDLLLEFGLPSLELGRLASARHDWEAAQAYFRTASGIAGAEDLQPLLAETYLEWGRMLLTRHRPDDLPLARELVGKAQASYHDLGMERCLAKAELALADPRLATAASVPLAYPDGLSEREVEVLRLVAAGKSNQAIADELVISRNTVGRHVNHIFTKTRTANRTEAATYAHRRRLVQ